MGTSKHLFLTPSDRVLFSRLSFASWAGLGTRLCTIFLGWCFCWIETVLNKSRLSHPSIIVIPPALFHLQVLFFVWELQGSVDSDDSDHRFSFPLALNALLPWARSFRLFSVSASSRSLQSRFTSFSQFCATSCWFGYTWRRAGWCQLEDRFRSMDWIFSQALVR
jgi:hypothetical protein